MLTSYDSLHVKKCYLVGAILKKTKMLQCYEVVANKEKSSKDGKILIQEHYQERDQLSKSTTSFLRSCFYFKFVSSGSSSFDKIAKWMEMQWQIKLVWQQNYGLQ